MTTSASPSPAYPALTGLRFFAAAHVVVYHAFRAGLVDGSLVQAHPLVAAFAAAGPPAVTLFFVLSGFVLTTTQARAP